MHPRRPAPDPRQHVGGDVGIFGRGAHQVFPVLLPRDSGDGYICYLSRPEARMIPFFVQIKCQLGKSYQVANKLADAEIASEIYSTAGDFDLLVKFYVDPSTDIGHFIAEKVQTIAGVADTRTIITFKAFGGS
jgi:DNA-binding Lrp family transcriptional regulator